MHKPPVRTVVSFLQKFVLMGAAIFGLPALVQAAAAPVALDGDGWMVAPQAEVSGSGEQISERWDFPLQASG